MTNEQKYISAFSESLNVEPGLAAGLTYQSIPAWDSVGHMGLMAVLEEKFGIMLDTDDIIDFSSYEAGKNIMRKYDVEL